MTITLNGTTGITTPDLTSTDDITANSSAVLTSASLPTALNATGDAPIYAARAWVNFNGTGTVAIRAAGNVSSITDNATGDYTVNFTTAMPDVDYSVIAGAKNTGNTRNAASVRYDVGQTTTEVRLLTYDPASIVLDMHLVYVAVFR